MNDRLDALLGQIRHLENEPTVGLDPIARDAVWKHLVDLRANYGTTLFFTTHYLEEAETPMVCRTIKAAGAAVRVPPPLLISSAKGWSA